MSTRLSTKLEELRELVEAQGGVQEVKKLIARADAFLEKAAPQGMRADSVEELPAKKGKGPFIKGRAGFYSIPVTFGQGGRGDMNLWVEVVSDLKADSVAIEVVGTGAYGAEKVASTGTMDNAWKRMEKALDFMTKRFHEVFEPLW
jgi:hypothetical protein